MTRVAHGVDATGRSTRRVISRIGKLNQPPRGQPWCWKPRELLESPAWRGLSINARRLMDFLLIEWMNHAGTENGNLMATHQQLAAFGISKGSIRAAIDEVRAAGLVDTKRAYRAPTKFCLTFYPRMDGLPASNRWKRTNTGTKHKRQPPSRPNTPKVGGLCAPEVGSFDEGKASGNAAKPPVPIRNAAPEIGGPSISGQGRGNEARDAKQFQSEASARPATTEGLIALGNIVSRMQSRIPDHNREDRKPDEQG